MPSPHLHPPDSPEVLQRFHELLPLVERLARRQHRSLRTRVELDDLISAGREGLLQAARSFDPERGVPFQAFARVRVQGAVIDGVRSSSNMQKDVYHRAMALRSAALSNINNVSEGALESVFRLPKAATGAEAEQALDALLGTFAASAAIGLVSQAVQTEVADEVSVEELYSHHELMSRVREEIELLPEEEALTVSCMYFENCTIDQVAARLGCDRSWVSRLHRRAVDRLFKRVQA